jgi:hypothetical protein
MSNQHASQPVVWPATMMLGMFGGKAEQHGCFSFQHSAACHHARHNAQAESTGT